MQATSKLLILLLGLGYLAMLGTSLYQRLTKPSLTVSIANSQPEARQGAMDEIGPLMQAVSRNPADKNALKKLIRTLMAINQWDSAQNFAQKALNLDSPENPDQETIYLLAVIHHNQGRHREAAELLEKMLANSDNPSARYSLGILYLHYLDQPEAGIEQLEKGLLAQDLSPALAGAMREELARARLKQEPAAQPETPGGGDEHGAP